MILILTKNITHSDHIRYFQGSRKRLMVIVFAWILWGASASAQFIERSGYANISHVYETPLLLGGGACFFDANGDLYLDLYITSGTSADHLYINNGDGTFEDLSAVSGIQYITNGRYTSGVVSGDLDNDGDQDLFISTFDRKGNLLIINDGNGLFHDGSKNGGILEKALSSSSVLLDYDRDGLLDIYVGNYIDQLQISLDSNSMIRFEHLCSPNFLYHNLGEMRFEEVGQQLSAAGSGCTLAVASLDMDRDGISEVYVANDFGEWITANELYQWKSGSFEDISAQKGLDVGLYGMGIAIADINQDLIPDIYLSNISDNRFMLSSKSKKYIDHAKESGLSAGKTNGGSNSTSWGALFFDCDLDGDEDLYVAKGFITTAPFLNTNFFDQDRFFVNEKGQFPERGEVMYTDFEEIHRGAIYGDYDMDGMVDLFVVSVKHDSFPDAHSKLLQNNFKNENGWIKIMLEGEISNKDAYGATLLVYANGQVQTRQKMSGSSYASQSSPYMVVGLGEAERVDSIHILWPSGLKSRIDDLPVNEFILIRENAIDFEVLGCMDPLNSAYNPRATVNFFCGDIISSDENELEEKFSFFPNPGNDVLYINQPETWVGNFNLEIINARGELVDKNEIENIGSIYSMDVSQLHPGIYYLKFKSDDQYLQIVKYIKL